MMGRRRGIAVSVVVLTGVAVLLAMTSPWSSESDRGEQRQAEREFDPLAASRKLVGGEAHFTNCRDQRRKRLCEVEGPTGKRAICFMFKGGKKGEFESYSCFDRYVGEGR
jgi:hypothetical protein